MEKNGGCPLSKASAEAGGCCRSILSNKVVQAFVVVGMSALVAYGIFYYRKKSRENDVVTAKEVGSAPVSESASTTESK